MNLGLKILVTLITIVGIGAMTLLIYIYAKYSNVPVKDLPSWVVPFFIH